VIVVTPTPSGSIYSDGRFNRIWIWVIGNQNPYVEAGNSSVIDIYMNSANYSIGGVYINTNFYFLNDANKIKIIDSAGSSTTQSSPSATGGCRHVRLTYFGSPFNSTSNKMVYLQAFSSGNNTSTVLTYEYLFRPTVIGTTVLSVPTDTFIDTSIRTDLGGIFGVPVGP
jgi:hypothetical protein